MSAVIYKAEPATVNITQRRGDTLKILFDLSIDLTGYTFQAVYGSGNSMTVQETDLAAGKVTIYLTDVVTAGMLNTSYPWNFKFISGDEKRTFFSGTITLTD